MASREMEFEENTEDMSSEFIVNSTYVTQFKAYKCGKIVFCMALINPSTPNITKLVDVPSKYNPPSGLTLWPVGGTANINSPGLIFRFNNNSGTTSLYYFGQPITAQQDIRVSFSYPLA